MTDEPGISFVTSLGRACPATPQLSYTSYHTERALSAP